MISGKIVPQRWKWRYGLAVLQLVVSLSLSAWLIQRVSSYALLRTLSQAAPVYVVLACCGYYIGVTINCYKWQLALAIESISVPLPRLVSWYLIGALATNWLPTSVGGDVVRGYYAIRNVGHTMSTSRSILVERLSGLLVALLLAWIGLITIAHQSGLAFALLLATVVGALGGGLGITYVSRLSGRMNLLFKKALSIIALYRHKPQSIALILALSFVFQLLAGFGVWCNLRAVQLDVPFIDILLISSIISIAGLLPVSINGWGVTESLFLVLLAPFHLPDSGILAGVLLGRALLFLVTLVGTVPLMLEFTRFRSPRAFDNE